MSFSEFVIVVSPHIISLHSADYSNSSSFVVRVNSQQITCSLCESPIMWSESLYKNCINQKMEQNYQKMFSKVCNSELNNEVVNYYALAGLALYLIWYRDLKDRVINSSLPRDETVTISQNLMKISRYPLLLLKIIDRNNLAMYSYITLFIELYKEYFKLGVEYDSSALTLNLQAQLYVLMLKQQEKFTASLDRRAKLLEEAKNQITSTNTIIDDKITYLHDLLKKKELI